MGKLNVLMVFSAVAFDGLAFAALAAQPQTPSPAQPNPANICKWVVSAEPGARPYQLCMTRGEWEAKKIADAKDPNRMVCEYVEESGTRFRSAKVCMTAMEWQRQRTADREAIEQIQRQSCVPGGGC
jgi:hypothetical protein